MIHPDRLSVGLSVCNNFLKGQEDLFVCLPLFLQAFDGQIVIWIAELIGGIAEQNANCRAKVPAAQLYFKSVW